MMNPHTDTIVPFNPILLIVFPLRYSHLSLSRTENIGACFCGKRFRTFNAIALIFSYGETTAVNAIALSAWFAPWLENQNHFTTAFDKLRHQGRGTSVGAPGAR